LRRVCYLVFYEFNFRRLQTITYPKTIGILGGGQLARMTAYAAFRLGFQVATFEKEPNSPAGQITHFEFIGDWNSLVTAEGKKPLEAFATQSDIITLENEFIDPDVILHLEEAGKTVYPTSTTMRLVRDKFVQKTTFQAAGLAVAAFEKISSIADAEAFGKRHGFPFVLKARRNGYDGYGNATIRSTGDLPAAFAKLDKSSSSEFLYAEAFVNFVRELAVMVVRTPHGEVLTYPVVETIQENHICKVVLAPAEITDVVKAKAEVLARKAVERIDGIGIFGVELFETPDGEVLINEIAPRPHNSGHYTIEACDTSQFENHVRAVMGLPLGSPDMITPAAVMVNILGKRNGEIQMNGLQNILSTKGLHLHIYGKQTSRIGRKMGHITMLGQDVTSCRVIAQAAEQQFSI
jgi:5-(carboxyamino)imidazole ribonucleotide synthase